MYFTYVQEFTEPKVIEQGAYILIAIGAFIFIISFLGYCGAIKESRVLLTAYGLFLIIIFALQVAAIVLITIYKSHADKHTQDFLKDTINKYYKVKTEANAVTLGWDVVMSQVRDQAIQHGPTRYALTGGQDIYETGRKGARNI